MTSCASNPTVAAQQWQPAAHRAPLSDRWAVYEDEQHGISSVVEQPSPFHISKPAQGAMAARPHLRLKIEGTVKQDVADRSYRPLPEPPEPFIESSSVVQDAQNGASGSTQSANASNDDRDWTLQPLSEHVYERLERFFPRPNSRRPSGDTMANDSSTTVPEHGRNTRAYDIRLEALSALEGRDNSPASALESPLWSATNFKWVRGKLIGKGTYGSVYTALNVSTGGLMSAKQIELPQGSNCKDDSVQNIVIQALKMEIQTLRLLDHPHIMEYLGFEETPFNLTIFYEYVDGGTLGDCLQKYGNLPDGVIRSFTTQILSGLIYLHSNAIIHRDVKADNVLVGASGRCKLSNFSISHRSNELFGRAYTPMQGSLFWMAPEVVTSQSMGYDYKIDIWSVGCVVLEMWSGVRPWMDEEMVSVMFKLFQSMKTPPVPEYVVLGEDADDFRQQCFAINPRDRPSAADLINHPYLMLPPGWTFKGFSLNSTRTVAFY